MTDIIAYNPSINEKFNFLVESFPTDVYTEAFKKDLSELTFNYKCLRRIGRKMFSDTHSYHKPSLLSLKTTFASLNGKYWLNYFNETNLFILMTEKRSKEWKKQIENLENLPAFNSDNVRHVTNDILSSSYIYFAERIQFVLSHLSKNHITNSQFGFGEKIIIEKCHPGSTPKDRYPSFSYEKIEALDELRKIVAFLKKKDLRVMDKDQSLNSKNIFPILMKRLVDDRKSEHHIDNGTIHVRIFLKGTMHITIEPEIAEEMNAYVSYLYPNQIPSCLKKKSYFSKPKQNFILTGETVNPFVISELYNIKNKKIINVMNNFRLQDRKFDLDQANITVFSKDDVLKNNVIFYLDDLIDRLNKKGLYDHFLRVVSFIGGTVFKINHNNCILFEYDDITSVLDELCVSGIMDDKKSYQQYYTNTELSNKAYDLLTKNIAETDLARLSCIEPSCGNGSLLRLLPKNNTLGIDISKNNAAICKALGYKTINSDFIDFASTTKEKFDLCLMNPPFTGNQAYNHTMAAYTLLKENGSLTAILPSSLRGKFDKLKNENVLIKESEDYFSQFENTNVNVFLLFLKK